MTPRRASTALSNEAAVTAENPWPGLLSFREADQRWFQGRTEETLELLQHVKRERLTVLFALSGLGKSSLLQAGLFPALRLEGFFPVYVRLDYAPHSPDLKTQVFDTIALAGAASEIQVPPMRPNETLWEYFHNVENEFWSGSQNRVLPLVVFDQFEEVFTLGKDAARSQNSETFLDELADLAEGRVPEAVLRRFDAYPAERDNYAEEGEYKLLISLREDFLPELSDQHRRIASVPHKRYRLRQMNGDGALLAVSQAKDLVDETVAAQIVRYVAAGERLGGGRGRPLKDLDVEPALLSVVCRELNNRRRERGEPRISADLLEGSQEQVLNDFYGRSLEGMPLAVRTFIEEQLITVAGARNSVALDDALAAPGMTQEIIETLVERRLLRKEFRRNEVRIELTHDLLTGVVRASRDVRRNEEAIEKQRREAAEAQAKLRRSRRITLAFAVIAMLAVVTAVFAYVQQDRALAAQRNEAVQRKRAQDASQQATQNLKVAQEKEQERALEAKRAQDEAAAADAARQAAEQRRQEAVKSQQEAESANVKANTANNQLAAANSKLNTTNADLASTNSKLNTANKDLAASNEQVQQQNSQIRQQNVQIQGEVSSSLVREAVSLISTRQYLRGLGDIARALTLDGNSLAAKSLAFDQLLRGSWRDPVNPNQSGAGQFVHPPLTHPAGVLAAAFSPDGRWVATTAKDNKVRLWDWRAGTSTELGSHSLPATMVTFSPDGTRVLTASYDQTARVWDVSRHTQVLELRHLKQVISAEFSSDGRQIVTASLDHTAQIWDAATGAKIGPPMQHPMTVNFAAFSRDGTRVVTACADGHARVWDLATNRVLFEVQQQRELKSAAFSPDGTRLVTASVDGTARIWDVNTHLALGDPLQHSGAVYYAAFSSDGKRVATASLDKTARIWEASTGRPITAPLEQNGAVFTAVFSPDAGSHRLLTASDDKTAQVWEVWYDFDNTNDLITLLEGIGGYSGADEKMSPLDQAQKRARLSALQAKVSQQPATSFLRWFFAHRQPIQALFPPAIPGGKPGSVRATAAR